MYFLSAVLNGGVSDWPRSSGSISAESHLSVSITDKTMRDRETKTDTKRHEWWSWNRLHYVSTRDRDTKRKRERLMRCNPAGWIKPETSVWELLTPAWTQNATGTRTTAENQLVGAIFEMQKSNIIKIISNMDHIWYNMTNYAVKVNTTHLTSVTWNRIFNKKAARDCVLSTRTDWSRAGAVCDAGWELQKYDGQNRNNKK